MALLQMLALMALGADAAQATEASSAGPLTAMLVEGGLDIDGDAGFDSRDQVIRDEYGTSYYSGDSCCSDRHSGA